jgi:hypothetical protein
VRFARSTPAGVWFRVAILITVAQIFLSVCKDEWTLTDFVFSALMLLGTGLWLVFDRHRLDREYRRRRAGWFCIRCGYDLRATPDRCPECGEVTRRRSSVENHQ